MERFKKIEGGEIPDEDVPNWMKVLRENGFTPEEIDMVLERANENYRLAKHPHFVERELKKIEKEYLKKYNRPLTKDEVEYFRKGLESRLKDSI
jgi:DNA-binding transcriptional MerR regulator